MYAIEIQRTVSEPGHPEISLFGDSYDFVADPTLSTYGEDHSSFDSHVLHIGIEVQNGSDEIVGPITMALFDSHANTHSVYDYRYTAILPGQAHKFEIIVEVPRGYDTRLPAEEIMKGLQPVIEFRDSSGQWWSRRGLDPIQRLARGTHETP
ncbi:hypothetical protein LQ938_11565 [Microbacterium sp. cx-55]|uniref:hypothetical protein n=1 Tax=Microbacterium sp. cx-55 TaxID=2875948 RepID=UPI001CBBFBF8|nr:hypothetical protein [Microbacterium sp. cx-55]MBZ4488087.1 hypothetical protein [Microbacterium sp. cx-55]UGB34504.1 hypothetical protein LQ938_11565 [Microbacterium sp. cx-55]